MKFVSKIVHVPLLHKCPLKFAIIWTVCFGPNATLQDLHNIIYMHAWILFVNVIHLIIEPNVFQNNIKIIFCLIGAYVVAMVIETSLSAVLPYFIEKVLLLAEISQKKYLRHNCMQTKWHTIQNGWHKIKIQCSVHPQSSMYSHNKWLRICNIISSMQIVILHFWTHWKRYRLHSATHLISAMSDINTNYLHPPQRATMIS